VLGLEPVVIVVALLCGIATRAMGLPALIGYLAAGFVLHELGTRNTALLDTLANLGITLMLFTIGLKLEPKKLLETKVWGTTLSHMIVTQIAVMGLLLGLAAMLPTIDLDLRAIGIIAFALTFSSTVFVIQTMQERGETDSAHAALAIGILIVQDLVAVVFLAFTAGKVPHLSALALIAVIPLRPLILRVLQYAGYGELLTLCGLALALGASQISELVGIKGDLGALIFGAILAGHPKAKAMATNLLHLKDLFLVGFFLSIGLGGWPSTTLIVLGVFIGVLAALKPLLYFPLMTRFHTTPRTSILAAGTLGNHSEFGLIVAAVAVNIGWLSGEWNAALSIAIAVSFLIAAPINNATHKFYQRHRNWLLRFSSEEITKQLEPTDNVKVIILGMGRVGTGAYETFASRYGQQVLGIESKQAAIQKHREEHRRVIHADASDPELWHRIAIHELDLVMLALTNHIENKIVAELVRDMGYRGEIASVVRYQDHAEELSAMGISAFNLYAQAGSGFAEHAYELIQHKTTDSANS
jgi:predicted Kef-type K+ transport protein